MCASDDDPPAATTMRWPLRHTPDPPDCTDQCYIIHHFHSNMFPSQIKRFTDTREYYHQANLLFLLPSSLTLYFFLFHFQDNVVQSLFVNYNIINVTSHFQSLSVLHQTRSDLTMLVQLQNLHCKLTHHGFSSVSQKKRQRNTHTGVIFSNLTATEKLCLAPNTDSDVFWTLIETSSDVFVVHVLTCAKWI